MRNKKTICLVLAALIIFSTMLAASSPIPEEAVAVIEKNTGYLSSEELKTAKLEQSDIPEILLSEINIAETPHVQRLRDIEPDVYTIMFQNKDGTNSMYMYNEPVKYFDETDQSMKDRSSMLSKNSKNGFSTLNNDVKLSLPEKLNDLVSLEYNGHKISFAPLSLSAGTEKISGSEASAAKTDTKINDTARNEISYNYNKAFGTNTAVRYTPLMNGIKEDIILYNYNGVNEFKFTVKTNGLKMIYDESGSVRLANHENNIIAGFGEVFTYDSAEIQNTSVGSMTFSEIAENNEYVLTVTADRDYLEDPSTVYPVTVDPTLLYIFINCNYFEYLMVYSAKPTATNLGDKANTADKKIGHGKPAQGEGRLLYRFPGLMTHAQLVNLPKSRIDIIELRQTYRYSLNSSNPDNVSAHIFNGANWNAATTSFNTLGWNFYQTSGYPLANLNYSKYNSSIIAGSANLNIKGFYEYWQANPAMANKGIILINKSGKQLSSVDILWQDITNPAASESSKPYLYAKYEPYRIMLDAGHIKGDNKGAYSSYIEGDKMWEFHKLLKAELDKYGFDVGVTRKLFEKENALNLTSYPNPQPTEAGKYAYERGMLGKGYDLFLTLHSNGINNSLNTDYVAIIHPIQADSKLKILANSLGDTILNIMQNKDTYYNKTFNQGKNVTFMRYTSAPTFDNHAIIRGALSVGCKNVLILEHSYHSNFDSAKWLYYTGNLQSLAQAEALAILNFFKYNY